MAVAAVAGVDVLVKTGATGGTAILGQRGATLNIETDMVDKTTKASTSQAKEFLAGYHSWTVDCDGLLMAGGVGGIGTLVTAQLSGVEVDVAVDIGGDSFAGKALYKSISADGPHEKEGTYKASLQGTGPLTPTIGT